MQYLDSIYVQFLFGLLGVLVYCIQSYRQESRGEEEGFNAWKALGRFYFIKHPFRTVLALIGFVVLFTTSLQDAPMNIFTAFMAGIGCMKLVEQWSKK